jgi:hypothetical protein
VVTGQSSLGNIRLTFNRYSVFTGIPGEPEIYLHQFYNQQYLFLYSAVEIRSSHFKKNCSQKQGEHPWPDPLSLTR